MKIIIVSMWYNEAFLAPFFLGHYDYADEIRIIIDSDTDDDTRQICSKYRNVKMEEFKYPDMYDCRLHVEKINEVISCLDCDWIIVVDADEFIFPETFEYAKEFLARQKDNLLYAKMWHVYRHRTESDLDPTKPAIWQRRHGDSSPKKNYEKLYNKPIIVRPEAKVAWKLGFHSYHKNNLIRIASEKFIGTHWKMADVNMAIESRIKNRRERQSKRNLECHWGRQDHKVTEKDIREECNRHLDDPKIF